MDCRAGLWHKRTEQAKGACVLIYQLVVLAIVQGLTEFLPISSSGHLVVTSQLMGWQDQGLELDIAVHVGTLFAVMIYFWRDVGRVVRGGLHLATFRGGPDARMALLLLVATLPIVAAGYFGRETLIPMFRSVEIIAWTTLVFGIVLWIADRSGMTVRRIEHMSWVGAIFIGAAQVLALVPGTSRSGITMTAGRILGMERPEAARFSLLLSIPTIAGAGTLIGLEIYQSGNLTLGYHAALAAGFAFLTGLAAVAAMMRWLQNSSFTPFVLYRVALGGALLLWVYI